MNRSPRIGPPTPKRAGNLRQVTTLPILSAEEQRVLGCLLEKQITVPDSYPLTMAALRTACNQKSSRDPVTDYDERTVQDTARMLKDRGLLRVTWLDYGRRTLKYAQTAVEALGLADDERALLTVLLLRGPQSPGELKTRSDRIYEFADRDAVEAVLQRMAQREEPLVARLERRPGQQDHRWAHRLGEAPVDAPAPPVDREQVLAAGSEARDRDVVETYDAVAEDYAEAYGPVTKPFERWMLTRVAELAGPHQLADVGAGPGDVTALLAEAGAAPKGFDVSPRMVEVARARHPELDFEVGDLRRLLRPGTAAGWGAVVSWFSLIHLAPSELTSAVRGLAETLLPDGALALAIKTGNAVEQRTQWLGRDVRISQVLHDPSVVLGAVRSAGLTDLEVYLTGEAQDRLYVIGRRG